MADSGGRSGTYDERRVPLEDSDHLAVHCVHIFMQNLYHYATQNTVRMLVSSSVVGLSTITWKRARLRTILCGFHLWRKYPQELGVVVFRIHIDRKVSYSLFMACNRHLQTSNTQKKTTIVLTMGHRIKSLGKSLGVP